MAVLFPLDVTTSRNAISSSSPFTSPMKLLLLHTDLKCPFLEHLWHITSLAGHCILPWGGNLPHLEHTSVLAGIPSGLEGPPCAFCGLNEPLHLPFHGFGFGWALHNPPLMASIVLSSLCDPRNVACCDLTASLWRTTLTALFRFRSDITCMFSDSAASLIPMTI